MGLFVGNNNPSAVYVGSTPASKVFVGTTQVRPSVVPPTGNWLCFTAEGSGCSVQLTQNSQFTPVSLETSTDGTTWTSYTIGNTINLPNVGDKVYRRNTSTTNTVFSLSSTDFYRFIIGGHVGASGDITTLINKNGTNTVGDYAFKELFHGQRDGLTTPPELPATNLGEYCYRQMFDGCFLLRTAPVLPATTLAPYCYYNMFYHCFALTTPPHLPATTLARACYHKMFHGDTGLTSLPELPALTLERDCYREMFYGCENIGIDSSSSYGIYEYRVPSSGTGTDAPNALLNMFADTGGGHQGTIAINTTYYTNNTIV